MPIKQDSVFFTLYDAHLKSITTYVDGRELIKKGFPPIHRYHYTPRPPSYMHELQEYRPYLDTASLFLKSCKEISGDCKEIEVGTVAGYLDALLDSCFYFSGCSYEIALLTALHKFIVNYSQHISDKRLSPASSRRFFIDYVQTQNPFSEPLSRAAHALGRAIASLTKVHYDRVCADTAEAFAYSLGQISNVSEVSLFNNKTFQIMQQPELRHASSEGQHIYDQHFGLIVRPYD